MSTVVHVTHEAIQKVGGIGAVLQGFFTAKTYNEGVKRSILVGPLGGRRTRRSWRRTARSSIRA